jgi:hypothetical protein
MGRVPGVQGVHGVQGVLPSFETGLSLYNSIFCVTIYILLNILNFPGDFGSCFAHLGARFGP